MDGIYYSRWVINYSSGCRATREKARRYDDVAKPRFSFVNETPSVFLSLVTLPAQRALFCTLDFEISFPGCKIESYGGEHRFNFDVELGER